MSKATGSKNMKANGKTQVSIYLRPDQLRIVDAVAKKTYRKRANVVLGFVLDGLKREGKS